jgi:hypothetical protein
LGSRFGYVHDLYDVAVEDVRLLIIFYFRRNLSIISRRILDEIISRIPLATGASFLLCQKLEQIFLLGVVFILA